MSRVFERRTSWMAACCVAMCGLGLGACNSGSDVAGEADDNAGCEGSKCDSPLPGDADGGSSARPAGDAGAGGSSAGPVGELEQAAAVVLANPDGFTATLALHNKVAKSLPAGVKLVVIQNPTAPGVAPAAAITIEADIDSPWARDFAPTFVRTEDGSLEAVDFHYGYEGSDRIAAEMATKLGIAVTSSPLAIEGGNLLADRGRLFITDKALAANKTLTKAQIEAKLKKSLHVDHIEWMPRLPDEATGHIDMYAKLIAPGVMLVTDTTHLEQKKVMDDVVERFKALGYNVVRVMNLAFEPTDPDVTSWGPTLSYANSLIVNGMAFVPQYNSELFRMLGGKRPAELDRKALDVYKKAGLLTVGVPAADLSSFRGSVHCMTNSIPAGVDVSKLGAAK